MIVGARMEAANGHECWSSTDGRKGVRWGSLKVRLEEGSDYIKGKGMFGRHRKVGVRARRRVMGRLRSEAKLSGGQAHQA